MNAAVIHNGIHVLRASRLEALLGPLNELIDAQCQDDPFCAPDIVIAHPGMRQWLMQELAALPGSQGGPAIAANLNLRLPGEWLDATAQQVLGSSAIAIAPYRRQALRWRVHQLLLDNSDRQIQSFLHGGQSERRSWHLADQLAKLFAQYQIYRPDVLSRWQRGQVQGAEPKWQANLWRQLREQIGVAHRAERSAELVAKLQSLTANGSTPLHVFGLNHLPRDLLDALTVLKDHRQIYFYFADPCREYWGGLGRDAATLAQWRQLDDPQQAAKLLDQVGHPLLLSLGRLGQHLGVQIEDLTPIFDQRHFEDQYPKDAAQGSLLHALQDSIRAHRNLTVRDSSPLDRSLLVHDCHTRLRELEVLRDAIYAQFAEKPGQLDQSQILVMAPDIAAYAPLIPAVFSNQRADGSVPLRWFVLDHSRRAAHPVYRIFEQLLSLADARLTQSEIRTLIEQPYVQAALGIDERDVEQLASWLEQGNMAWGLNAQSKQRHQLHANAQHTLQWLIDRLLAGVVLGDVDDLLPESDLLALPGGAQSNADLLDALIRLRNELGLWQDAAEQRLQAAQWAEFLRDRLGGLIGAGSDDHEALAAIEELQRVISRFQLQLRDCGVDPPIAYSVMRAALVQALEDIPEHEPRIGGAICFSGMVPQRAIPYQMIAVLGLNDGEFPRQVADTGLDIMRVRPRLGDREQSMEDRYLFLEAIMSARSTLHLSFLGRSVDKDEPRNPATPLFDLLQFLRVAHGHSQSGNFYVKHPLHAFDSSYFDPDKPALHSFNRHGFIAAQRRGQKTPVPWLATMRVSDSSEPTSIINLAELRRFWRGPGEFYLRHALGIRLHGVDALELMDTEPLDSRYSRRAQIEQRVLRHCLLHQRSVPESVPTWLSASGLIAAGAPGALVWRGLRELALSLQQQARATEPLNEEFEVVDLDLNGDYDGLQLHGQLRDVVRDQSGRLFHIAIQHKNKAPELRQRLAWFIDYAALSQYAQTQGVPCYSRLLSAKPDPQANTFSADPDQVNAAMRSLCQLYQQGLQHALAFYPVTGAALLGEAKIEKAVASWYSDSYGHTGELDYEPGYLRLLHRDHDVFADHKYLQQMRELAQHIDDLVTLQPLVVHS